MRRSKMSRTAAALPILLLLAASTAFANEEVVNRVDWKRYGENLGQALESGNWGLQRSALQMIIQKGDRLNYKSCAIQVLNVYLTHEHEGFRQLALVALHKIQNAWALEYLRTRIGHEKSPRLKRLMGLILTEYDAKKKRG